jgi:hypothetical protein
MTTEIIEMAKEAGWSGIYSSWTSSTDCTSLTVPVTMQQIEAFAKLVAVKEREACGEAAMKAAEKAVDVAMKLEREACAQVAEHSYGIIGSTIALAIRARGEA